MILLNHIFARLTVQISLFRWQIKTLMQLSVFCFCCFSAFLVAAAQPSNPNGDFGEWNAFPGGQMPASAQTSNMSGNDLFAPMNAGPSVATPTAAPAPASGSGLASANLFDLMGPTQSLTSSQSLSFSMSNTQSVSTTVLPQSKSQVCMIALIHTHILVKLLIVLHIITRLLSGVNRIQVESKSLGSQTLRLHGYSARDMD